MFCKKRFPKNLTKKISVLKSLPDTIKERQTIRLATLLKRHTRPGQSGISEPAVCWSSTKQVFLNNSENSQENTYVSITFLRIPCFTEYLQWLLLKVSVFQPATSLWKRLREKCFSVNFAKLLRTSFLLTELLRMTAPCVYLWILSFSEHFFYRAPLENCYFVYQLKNFNHQIQ